MKNYKYLLFDADNTLYDFNLAEKQAFLSLSSIYSGIFDEYTYNVYHSINDKYWKKLEKGDTTRENLKVDRFREFYTTLNITADEDTINRTSVQYLEELGRGNMLISGALETIEYLSESYKIYIITNGTSSVQRSRFDSSAIRKYIKELFISEEIGYDKPSKNFFEYVFNSIGDNNTENYLVIGDSLTSDIAGAVNSGIDCVFFDRCNTGHGELKVNHDITSLIQLKDIL